jgi:hypothetical protein
LSTFDQFGQAPVTNLSPPSLPAHAEGDALKRRAEQQRAQRRWKLIFIALVIAIPVTIGAWIVSVDSQTAVPVPAATCQTVAAALSDGPDPSADPVGYAEAQVLPLRQITTSDAALGTAILQLSSAYESFYKSNGSKASSQLVSAAAKKIDQYCPGAAS